MYAHVPELSINSQTFYPAPNRVTIILDAPAVVVSFVLQILNANQVQREFDYISTHEMPLGFLKFFDEALAPENTQKPNDTSK